MENILIASSSIDKQNTEVDILFRHLMFKQNREPNIFDKKHSNTNDFEILIQNTSPEPKSSTTSTSPTLSTPSISSTYVDESDYNTSDCVTSQTSDKSFIYTASDSCKNISIADKNKIYFENESEAQTSGRVLSKLCSPR